MSLRRCLPHVSSTARFVTGLACGASCLALVACAGGGSYKTASSAYALPAAKPPPAPPPPQRYAESVSAAPGAMADKSTVSNESVTVTGSSGEGSSGGGASTMSSDEAYAFDDSNVTSATPTTTAGPTVTAGSPSVNDGKNAAPTEMFDIEARLTIEVDKVNESREVIRKMVKDYGGNVIGDELNADGNASEANFELRIPSPRIEQFLDGIVGVGRVRGRDVKARDVGKEYHDSLLLLENLETTMARYQDILQKAKDVKEILAIENELARLRTQIDQVKGNITWLKDRTARSTVYLRLVPTRPDFDLDAPEPKFFPGLRTSYLLDARGEGQKDKYVGFGLSLQFARAFTIDIDGMRKVGDGGAFEGLQAFIVTMGGDIYSDYFGGGRRRWFNPYLGARAGYARILALNDFAATGVVGLEIFKSKTFLVDLQFRLHGFFGNKQGAHVGLQPSAGFNFAF